MVVNTATVPSSQHQMKYHDDTHVVKHIGPTLLHRAACQVVQRRGILRGLFRKDRRFQAGAARFSFPSKLKGPAAR